MEDLESTMTETLEETGQLVCAAAGIRSERNAGRIVGQLEAMQVWGSKDEDTDRALAAFEMLIELKPSNALEAMLVVQMVGAHEAALLFLKRATIEGQTFQGSDANVLRATRLMRLFNEQLEALAKLKGKAGQQKVTVEHVHVYQGGQAIVGPVTAAAGERGRVGNDET